MNRFAKWTWIALIFIISFNIASGQSGETQPIERLVLRQTATQSELLSLNADGSITFITVLDDVDFRGNVRVAVDVAPSPDGQHVAFTTLGFLEEQSTLFLVNLNPLRVRQFDAPDVASIEWSPSGDALLLGRPSIYIGSRIGESGKIHVFDLATETFTLVAETNEVQTIRGATWSPTGEHIILTVDPRRNPDELHISDLHLVARDGTDWQQLTNLFVQAPQDIDFEPFGRDLCVITNIEWSASNARIYYVLTCGDMLISLFSVDLDNNNRLEVDLLEHFPVEFNPLTPDGYLGNHELINMFVGIDATYLVVNSPSSNLSVIRVNAPGQAEIIAAAEPSESLFAAISEDKTKIAFSERVGLVGVIDLTTNTLDILDLTDRELSVCRVQWAGNSTVLIDEVALCGQQNPQFFLVRNTIAWTPETSTIENITDDIGGNFNLIIPLPEIPEIPAGINAPPNASAGDDLTVVDADGDGLETIVLDSSGSSDRENAIAQFDWFENGALLASGATPSVTLATGSHVLVLRVTDTDGATDIDEVVVTVEEGTTSCPNPTITVTAGDVPGLLIAAINTANGNGVPDVILLAADSTYTLTAADNQAQSPPTLRKRGIFFIHPSYNRTFVL